MSLFVGCRAAIVAAQPKELAASAAQAIVSRRGRGTILESHE
jgi:hypothetical protein